MASGMIAFIRFDRARQVAIHFTDIPHLPCDFYEYLTS
jgi:hypothetical protein